MTTISCTYRLCKKLKEKQHYVKVILIRKEQELQKLQPSLLFKVGVYHVIDNQLFICYPTVKKKKHMSDISSLQGIDHRVVDTIARFCINTTYKGLSIALQEDEVKDFILQLQQYYFSPKKSPSQSKKLVVDIVSSIDATIFNSYLTLESVIDQSKRMISSPANLCTVDTMLSQAESICKDNAYFSALHYDDLLQQQMHCFAAVGQGAKQNTALGIVKYQPLPTEPVHILLVGKGIVYDTGGLSIKPSQYMYGMHTDMAGAAVVHATMDFVIRHQMPINIVALYALAENAVSNSSYRPGDIYQSMSGKTVEIVDTDAEGRLVLCDAMSYGQKNFKPNIMIDLATLTGAAAYVGNKYSVAFSNNTQCERLWTQSALEAGEPSLFCPLMQDMHSVLVSKRADMTNCALRSNAGHVVAALFLEKFVNPKQKWIHIDIAGSATDRDQHTPTGKPIQTLINFISKIIPKHV